MTDFSQSVNALLEYGATDPEIIKEIQYERDRVICWIEREPALFVLCCVADKNIDAKIVWNIPNYISCSSFADLEKISQNQWQTILKTAGYIRCAKVADEYVDAIKHIRNVYDGHAEKIWTESKSFAEIIVKFLKFKGIGKKIATMATNMLNRYKNIGNDFTDKHFMDISPDTHVKQIFNMLGFVDDINQDNTDIIVYTARALNPDAPYLLDYPCYIIGKKFCKKRGNKLCQECPMGKKQCCPNYEKYKK